MFSVKSILINCNLHYKQSFSNYNIKRIFSCNISGVLLSQLFIFILNLLLVTYDLNIEPMLRQSIGSDGFISIAILYQKYIQKLIPKITPEPVSNLVSS